MYNCISCKVKSCLSNYCTFYISYVATNTQKYQITSKKKNYSWWTFLSLLLVRPKIRFSSTSHLMFSIVMHQEKISLNAAPIPCNDQLWCPHMQHSWHPKETSDLVVYDHILSTSMLKETSSTGFKNGEYGGRNSTVILSCAANQSRGGQAIGSTRTFPGGLMVSLACRLPLCSRSGWRAIGWDATAN